MQCSLLLRQNGPFDSIYASYYHTNAQLLGEIGANPESVSCLAGSQHSALLTANFFRCAWLCSADRLAVFNVALSAQDVTQICEPGALPSVLCAVLTSTIRVAPSDINNWASWFEADPVAPQVRLPPHRTLRIRSV